MDSMPKEDQIPDLKQNHLLATALCDHNKAIISSYLLSQVEKSYPCMRMHMHPCDLIVSQRPL